LGGHRARRGFRFQDLWIAFNLLDWVAHDDFRGVVNEGVEDVDASWFRGGQRGRKEGSSAFDWKIYQLKDTTITPKLLVEILDAFHRKEAKFPGTWSSYHVVATRAADRLNALPELLRQTRNVIVNYGSNSPLATDVIKDFASRLRRTGVETDAAFVVHRVEFHFDASWVSDTETFSKQFNLRLSGLGILSDRAIEAGQELIALISGEKVGSLLTRETVIELLKRFGPAVSVAAKLVLAKLPAKPKALRSPARILEEPTLVSVFPGGAVLLRLPGGAHGLVDCNMAAASEITRYLDQRKVHTLDFVAISHWHSDRFNGILSVISAVKRVGKLLVPSSLVSQSGQRFLDQIASEGLQRYGIGELAVTNARAVIWELVDGTGRSARVEAFAADIGDPDVQHAAKVLAKPGFHLDPNINDYCTVFRVSMGGRSFLITTDATIKRWTDLFKRLLRRGESLRCDGMTVPHHGSKRSLNKHILRTIAEPSGFYAVVDPDHRFALPHRAALDLVRASNGEILVCETAPVHLLLMGDGLFERRFALSRPGNRI
jgi:beta-lactamase superfamily II metal-dependent hydrolase